MIVREVMSAPRHHYPPTRNTELISVPFSFGSCSAAGPGRRPMTACSGAWWRHQRGLMHKSPTQATPKWGSNTQTIGLSTVIKLVCMCMLRLRKKTDRQTQPRSLAAGFFTLVGIHALRRTVQGSARRICARRGSRLDRILHAARSVRPSSPQSQRLRLVPAGGAFDLTASGISPADDPACQSVGGGPPPFSPAPKSSSASRLTEGAAGFLNF